MHRQGVRSISAAADSDDDFERIAIGEHFIRMAAAWHDFAVALDRDAFAREMQVLDKVATVQRAFELMGFAVDSQCNHLSPGSEKAAEIFAVGGRFGNRCSQRPSESQLRVGAHQIITRRRRFKKALVAVGNDDRPDVLPVGNVIDAREFGEPPFTAALLEARP